MPNCFSRQQLSFPDPKAQEFGLLIVFSKGSFTTFQKSLVALYQSKNHSITKHKWIFCVHTFVPNKNQLTLLHFETHLHLKWPSQVAKTISDSTNLRVFFCDVRSPWKTEDSNGFPPRHSKMVTCSSISLFGTFQQSTWKYQGSSKFPDFFSYVQ